MSFLHDYLDTLLPRRCKICGQRLAPTEEEICGTCNLHLPRTHYYRCTEDNKLTQLFWGLLPVERAFALFFYEPRNEACNIIQALKYHDHPHVGHILGQMIAQECTSAAAMHMRLETIHKRAEAIHKEAEATHIEVRATEKGIIDMGGMEGIVGTDCMSGRDCLGGTNCMGGRGFFEGIDIIIPVPLHHGREKQRGYNQSEEIARGISSLTGIPIANRVVGRTRFIKSQTRLTTNERMENVKEVFKLLQPEKIKGKHILLVDDIITTGATIYSLAQELQKADNNITFSIAAAGFTK